ncbi:MAG TPA: WYL domain-containing protein [Acidimicrobiales bacterium]|nr:WYL domain-containing protein [Acidimicrobiales bacterium]
MPDRLARLTNLVALLLNARRPLTLEEIAAELDPEAPYPGADEARRQAFERDKRVLREEGIPVEAVSLDGEGGRVGYRIRPEEYQLPDLDLTADERIALHLALAAVPLAGGWGTAAGWKLDGGDGGAGGAGAAGDGVPDVAALAALPSVEALPSLFDGWRRRAPVSFGYHGEERTIDPYGLLFRDGFWYVVGHDHAREALRRFRADRIEGKVRVGAPGEFEVPEGFDPAATLPGQPFRVGEGEAVDVDVAVDAVLAAKVTAEVGEPAVREWRPDGSVVVRVGVTNRAGLRSWVLGMLDHAEVLGPPEVREDVAGWLRAVAGANAGAAS